VAKDLIRELKKTPITRLRWPEGLTVEQIREMNDRWVETLKRQARGDLPRETP
jgi:hypothetical protein